jgi:hypothetical protein
MHHRRAGARGADDRFAAALFKDFDESFGQLARFRSVARVEGRLPAAGLPRVESDFAARAAQHLDRARTDSRPQLVYQTGDE